MTFSQSLFRFAGETKRTMDDTFRGVILEMSVRFVMRSPVDTGRFRGNWQIGEGRADTRTDSENDKQVLGSPPSAESYARWQDQMEGVRAGQIVYITNNLPYARRLEYEGWSKQAPGGMVRLAMMEYQQVIRKALEAAKK